MRNRVWLTPWFWMLAVALCCGVTNTVQADWSDNFNGGFQEFWQFGSDGGDANTFLGGQVINDQLVLTADTTPDAGGAQTGFGVVITESFTDVRMTGVINPGGDENINDTVGLLLRGNTVNQTFYMAEVNYSESSLIIFRNNPGVAGGSSNLATATIPNLAFSDSVYVEIEAIGSNLEAWVYENATKTTLLANVSHDDTSPAALSSGLSGVLANENFGGLPVLGVWDDVTASSIISTSPGDIDEDGDVDGTDFLEIQRGFGNTTNAQDLTDWQNNYGNGSLSAITAVPEPTGLALALSGILLAGIRRRNA